VTKFPSALSRAEADAERRAAVPQVFLPIDQIMEGRWMVGVPCSTTDPEIFHSYDPIPIAQAQDVCAECPFIQPCREYRYATGASGTWGGVYYADSSAGVRNVRKKCALQRCTNGVRTSNPYCSFACEHKAKAGTRTGYNLHQMVTQAARAAGMPITDEMRYCGPCRDAKAADRGQTPLASGPAHRRPAPVS